MCQHCEYNGRLLTKLIEKVSTMEKIITHNSGALIQPKWVNAEVASKITGMGKTWMKLRQVRTGGQYNPIGIFRTRIQDKELVFFKKDLDAYERFQLGELPEPEPIQMKMFLLKKAI
jgi:hypothetical protein